MRFYSSFSTLTAQTLNSGMRLTGSSAALVRRLTDLFIAPVERDEDRVFADARRDLHFEGRAAAPRHQIDRLAVAHAVTLRPRADEIRRSGSALISCNFATRRVCAPDWYCASTRPVVRKSGYSASVSSSGAAWRTA